MRMAVIGGALLLLGALALPLHIVSPAQAGGLWVRVWPILLFVVAISVVTELAAEAGLFRIVAGRTAGWGRGRTWVLWLFVVAVAIVSTIFLSLDTTAVLLTPAVVVLARQARLDPLPFALTTVWLANAGSLLLPVSNLTNLLAQHRLGNPSPLSFAALTWAPAAAAVLVPVVIIVVVFRRSLFTAYTPVAAEPIGDRVLAVGSAVVVVALLPALVSGLPVWIPAVAAATLLSLLFAVRRPGREVLSFGLVPWRPVLFAGGLFLFLEALQGAGLGRLLSALSGGSGLPGLATLAAAGAVGANIGNNLPAYLALEPVTRSAPQLVALLVGVNAGPLIAPWASLATLLWHQRLRAEGIEVPWRRFILLGVLAAPLTVAAATLALWTVG